MKTRTQQGFTLIELLVVITIIAILASLAVPTFAKIQEKGNMTKGINNAKQIILTLKIYAGDNNATYPTGANANVAFRQLFVANAINTETVFGCPSSIYGVPDGKIGASPAFTNALETKENHWMLVDGLTDSATGPVVFEVANTAAWDPGWNADAAGKTSKGRTWSGGKIIVGINDGSVEARQCAAATGADVKLKGGADNLFQQTGATGTVLDVL